MSYRKYMLLWLLLILVMATAGAFAALFDKWFLFIPIVLIWGAVLLFTGRKVTEVVVDERVNLIAGRASRVAFVVFIMLAVITRAVLIYLDKEDQNGLFNIGLTLEFAACVLIVIYWAAFFYYNRKLGGKG